MEEMNKQTPQEPVNAEPVRQEPAKKKSVRSFFAARRAKKKAKKARYKQIRKELRQKKREAFLAKTFLGKCFYLTGRLLSFLCALAVVITVVRVNYKDVIFAGIDAYRWFTLQSAGSAEVTREEILELAPMDEERGKLIDASAPIDEGETWAVYMYIVGSNLEAEKVNQISDAARYVADLEAVPLKEARDALRRQHMTAMVDTVMENGLDLPSSMYSKKVSVSLVPNMAFTEEMVTEYVGQIVNEYMGRGGDDHAASLDIAEITQVTLPENVKVVLQPGGSIGWGNNSINPNRTQRFVYDTEGMHKVYEDSMSNMGNPQTLVDFLTFCEEEYPADHTMVVFWNHGGAAFGYGYDGIYLDDYLTLEELRWAFEQVYTLDEENPPVDIIGFDACLMASMEVAEALNGAARYLVASEELEPGYGWDYTDLLNRLVENPRMNPLQLSRAVADSYMDFYAGSAIAGNEKATQLYSVMDLGYADDLYQAYSDFAASALKMSSAYAGTAAHLGKAANSSIKFAGNHQSVYNTLDLGLFMQQATQLLPEESEAVLNILDKMVLYNRTSNTVRDATGLTVYYPATISDFTDLCYAVDYISQICKDPDIQALYYYKVAGCLPQELQTYVQEQGYGEILPMDTQELKDLQKASVTLLEDGNVILPATMEAITITQDFRYHLLQMNEDGTARKLGHSSYLFLNESNGIQSAFSGQWLQMDGVTLSTEVVSGTVDSLRFRVKVRHNGTESYLLLSADPETQEWNIIGIQPIGDYSDNTVLADRDNIQLNEGDILVPIYENYDIRTGVGHEVSGEEITYRADSVVSEKPLPDGTYMSYISLVDARGDVYDMQVTSFEIHNGVMGNPEIVKMP